MSKKDSDLIEFTGTVLEILPGYFFSVKLDGSEHILRAYVCGKLRKNCVRIIRNDRVKVEVSPTDTSTGRITVRLTGNNNPLYQSEQKPKV